MSKFKVIAIDGTAASGKGTLAKSLAKKLGYLHLDTGSIYRAATVHIIKQGINPYDEEAVVSSVKSAIIEAKPSNNETEIYLNGENLTRSNQLRTSKISNTVPIISKYTQLREQVRKIQKSIANTNNVVMEGRDVTTVVFPDAFVKFFITASLDIRAERRMKDLQKSGEDITFEAVKNSIKKRDYDDEHRNHSPLVCPKDAIIIDNGKNTIEESVTQMLVAIKAKLDSNNLTK